jgi:hypothetical protein
MIFQNLGLCDFLIGCADAYRTAEAQQSAQPMDGPARRLACNMLAEFFSAPLLDGKPKVRLVVDNSNPRSRFTYSPFRTPGELVGWVAEDGSDPAGVLI